MNIDTILINGGDLVSTWITKLEAHAEDVATLVNNAANSIVAKRKFSNDAVYADDSIVALAA